MFAGPGLFPLLHPRASLEGDEKPSREIISRR
jgi:hypothetical protein